MLATAWCARTGVAVEGHGWHGRARASVDQLVDERVRRRRRRRVGRRSSRRRALHRYASARGGVRTPASPRRRAGGSSTRTCRSRPRGRRASRPDGATRARTRPGAATAAPTGSRPCARARSWPASARSRRTIAPAICSRLPSETASTTVSKSRPVRSVTGAPCAANGSASVGVARARATHARRLPAGPGSTGVPRTSTKRLVARGDGGRDLPGQVDRVDRAPAVVQGRAHRPGGSSGSRRRAARAPGASGANTTSPIPAVIFQNSAPL